MHRTILVVDVKGFGDRRRTNPHQVAVRKGLYQALRRAFDAAGIPWAECSQEDSGDGVLVLVPAEIPKAPFVDSVPHTLAKALHEHNNMHPAPEQIRLRMALHAGEVAYDDHGFTAASIVHTSRLLDAPPLKAALAQSLGVLALITSAWFFDEVVRHSQHTDPATYRPVRVAVKETTTVGWICLPDDPYRSDASVLTATPPDPAVVAPRQLPAPPRSFTGRADELAALTTALDEAARQDRTLVITAIGGAGGIGKTWLALHWAHQHLDHFPDGQLFVDLHGFASTGKPMTPANAVRGFLDALGVGPQAIPVDLDAEVGLYRSLVAGRRMLLVLDNARDTSQVTPLLPGTSTCTVLITSRDRLAGLVTANGARPVAVDVLDETDARALLTRRLGVRKLDAEPEAVAELLAWCAGLPLALSIVAGRAQTHPEFPLAVLAAELRDVATRLTALDEGDPAASLRAVLSWSYTALAPEQAEVFGLLGLALGPDISGSAVASLTALPATRLHMLLRALERVSLIHQHTPGRYRMHDLIRLYAAEQAGRDQPQDHQDAALRRLVDFYTHIACTGEQLLDPHRLSIDLGEPVAGCHPHPLTDEAAAWAWFDTEHPCLLAAQQLALDRGWHTSVWQLAWALNTFHDRRGHLHDELAAWQAGLIAANHLGDPVTKTRAHRRLGRAFAQVGRHAEALDHLQQALTLAKDAGDLLGQARTRRALARAWEQRGDDRQALEHATHALRLYQAHDDPAGEARALNKVGWLHARLGHYDQARTHCEDALTLFRRHHDRQGEANTLDSLGYVAHHTGDYAHALDYYQQAVALFRDIGNAYAEANTLDRLGHTDAALGQHEQARHNWQQALELYQAQHRTTDADRVQQQLDTLDEQ